MTRRRLTIAGVPLCVLMAAGCAHKAQTKVASIPAPASPPAQAAAPPVAAAQTSSAPAAVSPDLRASQNLVEQCKLQLDNRADAPKFDFDQFDLLPEDRTVLQQVADCVTKGPLKGSALRLVGRADPRGTEEYNLGLGSKRAHAVATYLELLGVKRTQLAETTRGAIDASGSDEAGWRVDRRVDLDATN